MRTVHVGDAGHSGCLIFFHSLLLWNGFYLKSFHWRWMPWKRVWSRSITHSFSLRSGAASFPGVFTFTSTALSSCDLWPCLIVGERSSPLGPYEPSVCSGSRRIATVTAANKRVWSPPRVDLQPTQAIDSSSTRERERERETEEAE